MEIFTFGQFSSLALFCSVHTRCAKMLRSKSFIVLKSVEKSKLFADLELSPFKLLIRRLIVYQVSYDNLSTKFENQLMTII